jgi:uncharacterized protein YndB with AHSA1/START domain
VKPKGNYLKVPGVRFERTLPGPVENIWQHLVDPRLLPEWYGEATLEAREGGTISLMGGHVRGLITRCRPPRLLLYTWNVFGPEETESAYPESYLTLELTPRGQDVWLTLTHLPVLERFEKQNAMGWHTFLDLLEGAVRGTATPGRKTLTERNARLYGVDLQNLVT